MVDTPPKKPPLTGPSGGYTEAEVVFHPHRLRGLIAETQANRRRLVRGKQDAIVKIEILISSVTAAKTEGASAEVNWVVNDLRLLLEEFRCLNPLNPSSSINLSDLAVRLQQASLVFLCRNSSALLNNLRQCLDEGPAS